MGNIDNVRSDLRTQTHDVAGPGRPGSPGLVTAAEARGVVERARTTGVSDADIREAFSSFADGAGNTSRYLRMLHLEIPTPPVALPAQGPRMVRGLDNAMSRVTATVTSVVAGQPTVVSGAELISMGGSATNAPMNIRGTGANAPDTRGLLFDDTIRKAYNIPSGSVGDATLAQIYQDNPGLAASRSTFEQVGHAAVSLPTRPAWHPQHLS